MSAPRHVVPGATYLVTRRCAERRFFLRPSRTTNDILLYVLAVASQRFDVRVHAFCVLSNHVHLVLTDPHARLPSFLQFLDALVARAVNASLGRWEAFWAPDSYSAVRLLSPADVVDKAAYVLANPVDAGLVGAGNVWPGLWSSPDLVGGAALPIRRPRHFFDAKGCMPEEAAVRLTVPPGFASADAFRDDLARALAAREEGARRRWRCRGGFLGIVRVLRQRPGAQPRSGEPRRGVNPRVAGRDKWKRIEALGSLAGFLRSYRLAWEARRAGEVHVVFPFGTYQLRVMHGVPCAPSG
jgi:putative transposase